MEQSLGVRVPSLAFFPSEDGGLGKASDLAAVLEEKHLGAVILEVKANRAIAADEVAGNAATRAHAVDLVDSEVGPDIKLAPRFDENSSSRSVSKK